MGQKNILRIRMARFGRRHDKHYRITVANSMSPRDGRFIEHVGSYCPVPSAEKEKLVLLNFDRIKHWLAVGAKPSECVAKLLGKAGILPSIPRGSSVSQFIEPEVKRQLSTLPFSKQ